MLLPAFGLLCFYSAFAPVAALVLSLAPRPGIRQATLIAFLLCGPPGFTLWGIPIGLLLEHYFPHSGNGVRTIAFLLSCFIFAVLFGWCGASLVARILDQPKNGTKRQ